MRKIAIAVAAAISSAGLMLAIPATAQAPQQIAHLSASYTPAYCVATRDSGVVYGAACAWSNGNENWVVSSGPLIQNAAGLCLTAVNREAVLMQACDGSTGQDWTISGAQIQSAGFPGWCLSWFRRFPVPGATAPCTSNPAQVWNWTVHV